MSDRKRPAPIAPAPSPELPGEPDTSHALTVPTLGAGAVSWTGDSPLAESLSLRAAVDPGCTAQAKDGWRATVAHWAVGPWVCASPQDGSRGSVISLLLIATDGTSCRLTGWPAVNSWAQLLSAVRADRLRAGIPVVVVRHPSGTPGRSYWQVMPDYDAIHCPGGSCD